MEGLIVSNFTILVGALVVLAIVIVLMGVKTVEQGYELTVERFGRYTRSLRPGLNLIENMDLESMKLLPESSIKVLA